jgi:hypothetical protein
MKSIALAAALSLAPFAFSTAANAATNIVGDSITCSTNTHPSSRCNGGPTAIEDVVGGANTPEFDIFATPNFNPLFTIDFDNGFFTLKSLGNRFISGTTLTFTNNDRAWATVSGGGALIGRATIVNGVLSLNLAQRTYAAGEEFTFAITAVPEPGAWMLMILGLGAVGFAMRRRQTTSTRYQFA